MSEPAAPAPQMTAQERQIKSLEEAVEKSWATLTTTIIEFASKKHTHLAIIHRAHELTPEQISAAAHEHRQAEADAKAALDACVGAQVAMMNAMDPK